ncbi:MAG: hypothetical protein CBB62_01840 [Micavibrio sp. TMED2]|nr:deoxycytidylate deaminase [Alphaproteobacteria bacterium]OUT41128.1 MAG: hypothetical protein CBB62_01840 [Micavibrio sp. TMED2]
MTIVFKQWGNSVSHIDSGVNNSVEQHELIIGLIAPIGVDLDIVKDAIEKTLLIMSYNTNYIKITNLMESINKQKVISHPFIDSYESKMSYANELRRDYGNDILARLAIARISNIRSKIFAKKAKEDQINLSLINSRKDKYIPEIPRNAYIIRQIKHPDEVSYFRRVYGKNFLLFACNAPEKICHEKLSKLEKSSQEGQINISELETRIIQLMLRDSIERDVKFGQRLEDAFPLSDFFINVKDKAITEMQIERFFKAFFGNNYISPTKDEYGMYMAKSSALKSIDVSRQVGAAIFDSSHRILSLGCNEVPKAGGGNYWEGDQNDARDMFKGDDPNVIRQREMVADLVLRLRNSSMLARKYQLKDIKKLIDDILSDESENGISKSQIMDTIEFGRVVHAEMNAITEAASKGVSISESSLYCTTFPCHICAKHIVASGIRRVVYIEPYPKSFAISLHSDSITLDKEKEDEKVNFEEFYGIAPNIYRDIFEKKKRKNSDGTVKEWQKSVPAPLIERALEVTHRLAEDVAINSLRSLMENLESNQPPNSPHDPARR